MKKSTLLKKALAVGADTSKKYAGMIKVTAVDACMDTGPHPAAGMVEIV